MELVLLGTAGGPVWATDRAGISSAVVVGDAVYLVDCGKGCGQQLRRAGLELADLRGIFITHLHSDHIADYFNLQLYGWYQNLERARRPVHAYGPGDRGVLPPIAAASQALPRVVNPAEPTPGLVGTTRHLMRAHATDINDRMRDNLRTDLAELVAAHDIAIPNDVPFHANENPSPAMDPFVVHEDDRVRVSATLVQHAPIAPAFGFRFDGERGSVVFSGDTGMSDNLVRLAGGADVLVHEVIDETWLHESYGPAPRGAREQAMLDHHRTAHTGITDTGRVAEKAGVSTLVLHHFVFSTVPLARWDEAATTFSGRVVVGNDLDRIHVGTPPE